MLKWIALALIALLIGLQVKLWVGEGGVRDLRAIRARVSEQRADNAKLQKRNEALHADVEDLKHGQDAVDARARSQLGLIKPGEVFYEVVGSPGAPGGVASSGSVALPAVAAGSTVAASAASTASVAARATAHARAAPASSAH